MKKTKHILFAILIMALILVACEREDKQILNDCPETCPQYAPQSPEFCPEGIIISGGTDECGCNMPPICQENYRTCHVDEDCIPIPSECHPQTCINKEYESNFERPEVCTTLFDYGAAYNPEDCGCENNICINKNINRSID